MVLEKTLERPLDSKEIKQVNPEENQPRIFIERTDAEAEVPIFSPPDGKADSLEKTLMLGKIESRRRRGQQRMKQLDGITDSMDMNLSKLREIVSFSFSPSSEYSGLISFRIDWLDLLAVQGTLKNLLQQHQFFGSQL